MSDCEKFFLGVTGPIELGGIFARFESEQNYAYAIFGQWWKHIGYGDKTISFPGGREFIAEGNGRRYRFQHQKIDKDEKTSVYRMQNLRENDIVVLLKSKDINGTSRVFYKTVEITSNNIAEYNGKNITFSGQNEDKSFIFVRRDK